MPKTDAGTGINPDAEIVRKAVHAGKALFLTPGGVSRVRGQCSHARVRPYLSTRDPEPLIERTISPADELSARKPARSGGTKAAPTLPALNPNNIRVIT